MQKGLKKIVSQTRTTLYLQQQLSLECTGPISSYNLMLKNITTELALAVDEMREN